MLLHLGFVPYSTCQGIGEADYDVWMMDNCQHCHHWGGVGGWHHTMYILAQCSTTVQLNDTKPHIYNCIGIAGCAPRSIIPIHCMQSTVIQ